MEYQQQPGEVDVGCRDGSNRERAKRTRIAKKHTRQIIEMRLQTVMENTSDTQQRQRNKKEITILHVDFLL